MVEILSQSTATRDRKLKRARYQDAGVPEYWIVDPFEQKVEQLVLRDSVYEAQPSSEMLQLTILDGVSVRLTDVWQENYQFSFRKMKIWNSYIYIAQPVKKYLCRILTLLRKI